VRHTRGPWLALAGTARKVALGYRRGVLMGRWVSLHRFALILCASLCFALASCGSVDATPSAHPQNTARTGSRSKPAPQDFAFGIGDF